MISFIHILFLYRNPCTYKQLDSWPICSNTPTLAFQRGCEDFQVSGTLSRLLETQTGIPLCLNILWSFPLATITQKSFSNQFF